jgi:hypothetical protein
MAICFTNYHEWDILHVFKAMMAALLRLWILSRHNIVSAVEYHEGLAAGIRACCYDVQLLLL